MRVYEKLDPNDDATEDVMSPLLLPLTPRFIALTLGGEGNASSLRREE